MERFAPAIVTLLVCLAPALGSDRIFSYLNENGVRVYTNAPSRSDPTDVESSSDIESAPEVVKPAAPVRTARGADLFRPLIVESSTRHDVDPTLVEAIMAVESAFNPFAVSVKDCKGLMQLHPDTAKRFGVDDVFDPAQNIEGGVKYLRYLQDFFEGDLEKVVAAYNAGENAVERHGGTPPYRETRDYVQKISARYDLTGAAESSRQREEEALEARSQRVHRIALPDGRILYTNTPSSSLEQ